MFTKVGPFLLIVGYFIPGVRHLTAYIAAINNYPYKKFAFFAYTGAFIWTFTFITLGKVLGRSGDSSVTICPITVFMSSYCLSLSC